jgi:hypothetical protein
MSAILSQLKRNSKLQLDCQRCKKVALRIVYGSIFLLLHLTPTGMCSALCIQYCRNKNGLWIPAIYGNIWANEMSSIVVVVVVVVNIHMDKKMVVDVRVRE